MELKEFVPAPETLTPDISWFSDHQRDIATKLGVTKKGRYRGSNQLAPHLYKHKNYVIHCRNLNFVVELGVEVRAVHKVLSFEQSAWLKPYIYFNTTQRTKAKHEFEKVFFRLMNNSVLGKTMENVKIELIED